MSVQCFLCSPWIWMSPHVRCAKTSEHPMHNMILLLIIWRLLKLFFICVFGVLCLLLWHSNLTSSLLSVFSTNDSMSISVFLRLRGVSFLRCCLAYHESFDYSTDAYLICGSWKRENCAVESMVKSKLFRYPLIFKNQIFKIQIFYFIINNL